MVAKARGRGAEAGEFRLVKAVLGWEADRDKRTRGKRERQDHVCPVGETIESPPWIFLGPSPSPRRTRRHASYHHHRHAPACTWTISLMVVVWARLHEREKRKERRFVKVWSLGRTNDAKKDQKQEVGCWGARA